MRVTRRQRNPRVWPTRHAAKPSTCRLFPTNRLVRAGEVTVVELQLASCPITEAQKDAFYDAAVTLSHRGAAAEFDPSAMREWRCPPFPYHEFRQS